MPRNVRNFWIEANIDGQATKLVGGPAKKEGGFSLTVKQRDGGAVAHALTITGAVCEDGTLRLYVETGPDVNGGDGGGGEVEAFRIESKRDGNVSGLTITPAEGFAR